MTAKNKNYLTLCSCFLLLVLTAVLVLWPLFRNISKDMNTLISAKTEILSIESKIENLSTQKKRYEEYKPNLNKIDALFINSDVPIDFIRFIEDLARGCQVSAEISSVPSAPLKNEWKSLGFKISTESSFLNLSRFLEKLENAPYLLEVQKVSLEKTAGEINEKTADKEISAELTIKVFAK